MKYVVYCFAVIGLLAVLMIGYSAFQFAQVIDFETGVVEEDGFSFPRIKEPFRHEVYFSSYVNPFQEFLALPNGSVNVFGHIQFNEEPAAGVELGVVLNGKYEVPVTTGPDGQFSFDVPEGKWTVNVLKVKSWEKKPNGKFVIVSGRESQLTNPSGYYKERKRHETDFVIQAQKGIPIDLITLKIEREIVLVSPAKGRANDVESPESYLVQWNEQKNTKLYFLKLSHVEKSGNSSSYSPVVEIQTESTTVPLSQFKVIKDEGRTNIYKVDVMGFDDDKNFISESPNYGDHTEFKLVGYKIASQRIISSMSGEWSPEKYQEFSKNRHRVAAVNLLIEDGLLVEAGKVIDRITENSEPGKIAALKGYLSAKKGECEQANRYFNQAISQAGKACVPEVYRQGC